MEKDSISRLYRLTEVVADAMLACFGHVTAEVGRHVLFLQMATRGKPRCSAQREERKCEGEINYLY